MSVSGPAQTASEITGFPLDGPHRRRTTGGLYNRGFNAKAQIRGYRRTVFVRAFGLRHGHQRHQPGLQDQDRPSGATVKFTNGSTCVSPCEISLKRRHDTRADIAKEGYKPVYVLVQSKTGGAAAGNILLGGLVGGVVDGATGSTNFLSPSPLSVKLVPIGADGEAQLLDKKDKVISTVQAHNDKVRDDVAKTIGVEAAGKLAPAPAAAPAAEIVPAPQPSPAAQ